MKKVGNVNCKEKQEDEGKVRVFCRFRPMNQKEVKIGSGEIPFKVEQNKTLVLKKVQIVFIKSKIGFDSDLEFNYDKIFTQEIGQEQIFDAVAKPIVKSLLDGNKF